MTACGVDRWRRRVAAGALVVAVGACGGGGAPGAEPVAAPALPAHFVAVCTGDQLVFVDPATGRVEQYRSVVEPGSESFQPTVREESAASRLGPTAEPASDCGTWSYDGALTHLAGSAAGRLAVWDLSIGLATPVTAAVADGADSPVCCDAFDPRSEALWYLRAGPGSTRAAPTYRLVGPEGTSGPTFFGAAAALTFVGASATPSVGAAVPATTTTGLVEVTWQPLPTAVSAPLPAPVPPGELGYGLAGALAPWDERVGVLRHADSGRSVAFVASAGRDCTLYTVDESGGPPHRLATLTYQPPADGTAGCGDEVVRYRP